VNASTQESLGQQMQLRDYLAVLRRRRRWLIFVVVVVMAGTAAWSVLQTPMYRSSAQVLMRSTPTVSGPAEFADTGVLANEVRLATSEEFVDELAERIGYAPDVSVRSESSASVLTFTARSDDPDEAARIADTHAAIFVELRREANVDDYLDNTEVVSERLSAVEAELVALEAAFLADVAELATGDSAGRDALATEYSSERSRLEAERNRYVTVLDDLSLSADLAGFGGAVVLNPAEPPLSPYSPNLPRNLATALFVSLVAGLGLAFLREHLDDTIKTRERLSAVIDPFPVISVIPKVGDGLPEVGGISLESVGRPRSPASESYQSLRTALTFLAIDRPFRTLQVTSAKMSEGKSTTAANLAVAMCRAEGKRVLLVDADLRRPRMHSLFALRNTVGLCDVLLRDLPMTDAVVPIEGFNGLLSVLPVGPRPSGLNAELLSSSVFSGLLREALDSFDLVILDTPPVLSVADPLTVSSQADAVLFVVHAGEATAAQVRSSLDALVGVGASVVGAILNSFDARAAGYHGYYGNYGYYGYYGYFGAGEYAETAEAGSAGSGGKRGRRGS